ncbi:hypothetical protein KKH05_01285 [Patescibacteria group bacterium]|nr:hypothetical protein [Patescibacteria group bacterium]
MRKFLAFLALALIVLPTSGFLNIGFAQTTQEATIDFFYSDTCPHCIKEQGFLNDLQDKYKDQLEINRYSIAKPETGDLLKSFAERYGAEKDLGFVPLTFVGNKYFVGFDSANGKIGQGIEDAVFAQLLSDSGLMPERQPVEEVEQKETLNIPFIGEVQPSDYSLPVLAVMLGTLDGFNVCSLGALILILGLTLELKSRKKIFLYGSIFLATTAIIYGVLIQLWYQLFSVVQGYMGTLSLIIGLLGLVGGIYFFREFLRMRKVGMVCKTTGASFIDKVMKKTEDAFSKPNRMFYLALAIALFAGAVAIIEFPCSAAIPVAFAGIMADAGVSGVGQFFLLSLFVLFYLLDEILIFAIAAWQMKIVLTSPNFTIWATFVESIFLFVLAIYYLSGLI